MKVIREFIKRKFNNFQDIFFYKKMFQGTKGYIAQMCMQYGNITTKWRFYLFLFNSILCLSILFVYIYLAMVWYGSGWWRLELRIQIVTPDPHHFHRGNQTNIRGLTRLIPGFSLCTQNHQELYSPRTPTSRGQSVLQW